MKLGIFEQIFSNKKFHLQILKQSTDIIKLFAKTNSLTPEMIDMIWEASMFDETAKLQIHEIIKDNANHFDEDIQIRFLDKISAITPSQLTLSELDLLSEIGTNARMKPNVKDKAC